jgi:DNA-binding transcriptional regulator YiaG
MNTRTITLGQREFLADAMNKLGMTPEQFAARLGTSVPKLEKWMLSPDEAGYQVMDEQVWAYIREITK